MPEVQVVAWKQYRLGGDCLMLGEFSLRLPSGRIIEDLGFSLRRNSDGTYEESFGLPSMTLWDEVSSGPVGGAEFIQATIKAVHRYAESVKPGTLARHIARAKKLAQVKYQEQLEYERTVLFPAWQGTTEPKAKKKGTC